MTNAWSLLYDDMITDANSNDYNDFWEQSYTYNNATTPVNEDKITFNIPDLPEPPKNDNGFWKYHEDVILKEIEALELALPTLKCLGKCHCTWATDAVPN